MSKVGLKSDLNPDWSFILKQPIRSEVSVGIGKPEWNPTPDWKPSWNFKTDLNPEWANRLEISRRFSIRSKSCVLTESAVCLEILKTLLKTHSLRIELRLLPTSLNDPTPDWNSSLPIPLRHVVVYLARSNLCGVSLVRSRISILFADSDMDVCMISLSS